MECPRCAHKPPSSGTVNNTLTNSALPLMPIVQPREPVSFKNPPHVFLTTCQPLRQDPGSRSTLLAPVQLPLRPTGVLRGRITWKEIQTWTTSSLTRSTRPSPVDPSTLENRETGPLSNRQRYFLQPRLQHERSRPQREKGLDQGGKRRHQQRHRWCR